jgi:hypothetical protein
MLQVVYVLFAVVALSACSGDPRDGGAGTTAGGSSMAGNSGDGAGDGGSETDAGSAGGGAGGAGDSGLGGASGDGGTDPCENIGCNDGNDCTADRCVNGFCHLEPVQISGIDCHDGFFDGQCEPGAGVCLVPCGAEDQECCDGASGCRSGLDCRPVTDGGSGMACVTE